MSCHSTAICWRFLKSGGMNEHSCPRCICGARSSEKLAVWLPNYGRSIISSFSRGAPVKIKLAVSRLREIIRSKFSVFSPSVPLQPSRCEQRGGATFRAFLTLLPPAVYSQRFPAMSNFVRIFDGRRTSTIWHIKIGA